MDSSGIRLWVTPTLRQYDSAVLQVGVIVGFQFIPHQQEERVLNTGWCPGACTTEVHGDVTIWYYWPFVRGIHRNPPDSPHKCTVM